MYIAYFNTSEVETYEEANRRCNKSTLTSNLESDEEEERRNIRKPLRYASDSNEADESTGEGNRTLCFKYFFFF